MRPNRFLRFVVLLACMAGFIVCPPVSEKPPEEGEEQLDTKANEDMNLGLEYERYLKEIVTVLESDGNFKKKLEESNISDIKSGEIAKHLDFVSHGIRTKLDEVKRKELDRLRQMMKFQAHMQNSIKMVNRDILLPAVDKERMLAHLDHSNPNSFEVSDLAKLIQQATKDLESIDRKRRDEFKHYEMEKELLRREELKNLDEEQRAAEEKKFQEMQKKHEDHPKLHHPGNEAQLKEVWQETDGLNKQDFDPKTFFHLHDTNGDGVLDQDEIEALFQKELDKIYDPNLPEDDMVERYEEMSRMREHVMNEVDQNKDKMISLDEFLESTKNEEFKNDEDWETLDKQKAYSDEELEQFQKQYEELQRQQLLKQHEQKVGLPEEREPLDHRRNEPVKMMHQQQQQQQQHEVQYSDHDQPVKVMQQKHQQQQQTQHEAQYSDHEQPAVVSDQKVTLQSQQQPVQGHQQPVQGHQQPPQGHQQPLQGHEQVVVHDQQLPAQGHQPVQSHQQPVQGHQQPIEGHQQPVQDQQPVQGHQQPVQGHQQPTEDHQQPVQDHQQPIEGHQQPVLDQQQPIHNQQQQVQSHQPVQGQKQV